MSLNDNPTFKAVKPFVNGGMSGMAATCCIQPLDMVKVRLQLGATGSPFAIAGKIIAEEGVGALYKGLSAGLVRQATYTTARYVARCAECMRKCRHGRCRQFSTHASIKCLPLP